MNRVIKLIIAASCIFLLIAFPVACGGDDVAEQHKAPAEAKPDVEAEVKPEVEPEVKPDVEAEVKPEVEAEVKPEVEAEVKH